MGDELVRTAGLPDLESVVRILNHYISKSHVTFDTDPLDPSDRIEWMGKFTDRGPHRLLVADDSGTVIGWASSTPFRPKPAYRRSVETTVYVDPDHIGRGIGRSLLRALLDGLAVVDLHRAYGIISLPNPASTALHESLGYRPVGVLKEAGHKFGKYWDVAIYERWFT